MGNASCDVHGIDEAKPLLHAALADELLDRAGDIDVIAPMRRFKPEMLSKKFHEPYMPSGFQLWQSRSMPGRVGVLCRESGGLAEEHGIVRDAEMASEKFRRREPLLHNEHLVTPDELCHGGRPRLPRRCDPEPPVWQTSS